MARKVRINSVFEHRNTSLFHSQNVTWNYYTANLDLHLQWEPYKPYWHLVMFPFWRNIFFCNAEVVCAYWNFVHNETVLGILQLNLLQFCMYVACRIALYFRGYYSGYISNDVTPGSTGHRLHSFFCVSLKLFWRQLSKNCSRRLFEVRKLYFEIWGPQSGKYRNVACMT
jgi:hypothetical protein